MWQLLVQMTLEARSPSEPLVAADIAKIGFLGQILLFGALWTLWRRHFGQPNVCTSQEQRLGLRGKGRVDILLSGTTLPFVTLFVA